MTYVRLHFWGVANRHVPSALARMGTSRLDLRGIEHLSFAKLLGTAKPTTFTPTATDFNHWGLLTVWDEEQAAIEFDNTRVPKSWGLIADETLRIDMTPIASHGQWAKREPFGNPVPAKVDGPVAAITRARIRPNKMLEFWKASEKVARSLSSAEGMVLTSGIGESPLGLQGTFSVWESAEAMRTFAYTQPAHTEVIDQTPVIKWYAEELFARFSVNSMKGRFAGMDFDLSGPAHD